jgi:hypothetical protein
MERLFFAALGQKGGLGNQLFQIAATIGIARTNQLMPVFPEWWYDQAFERPLTRANYPADESLPIYREESFSYRPVRITSSHIIDGYFQSEKYFGAFRSDILAQFALKEEYRLLVDRLFRKYGMPDCAMHVRRGDYVDNDLFADLTLCGYYQHLLTQMGSNTKTLVFSDDPDWCRAWFKDKRVVVANRSIDVIDLFLFAKCNVSVIANSSYSWWGAWLNTNAKATVFAPNRWFIGEFADETQPFCSTPHYRGFHDTSDLLPPHWVRIGVE